MKRSESSEGLCGPVLRLRLSKHMKYVYAIAIVRCLIQLHSIIHHENNFSDK